MQRAIGTLLRDDSIAVRRPFKKGAVCCLLLSSLSNVLLAAACVCILLYILMRAMRAWAPCNKILLRAVGVSEWCKRDQTRLFIYLSIYLSIYLLIDGWMDSYRWIDRTYPQRATTRGRTLTRGCGTPAHIYIYIQRAVPTQTKRHAFEHTRCFPTHPPTHIIQPTQQYITYI